MKWKNWYLAAFVVACLGMAAYEMLFFWYDAETSRSTVLVSNFVTIFFLIFWLDADSKEHPDIYRPYEYNQLLIFLWLPYLPYYLWRTRGVAGLFLLGGILGLYFSGTFGQLALAFAL
ncbi:hypothetical protein DBV14_30660 [Variovorax sp. KBW07]|uniref:hypothetical protein n=1 Tax=Variovorax sp. KBW07 TaxID=2153358 RepID=UPI000F56D617|nr:hypothetical protein [Variovorax sp. KBW07]RQO39722.1 hypothetical protein DBV14_30660 [Variovorax sp. KBW07]